MESNNTIEYRIILSNPYYHFKKVTLELLKMKLFIHVVVTNGDGGHEVNHTLHFLLHITPDGNLVDITPKTPTQPMSSSLPTKSVTQTKVIPTGLLEHGGEVCVHTQSQTEALEKREDIEVEETLIPRKLPLEKNTSITTPIELSSPVCVSDDDAFGDMIFSSYDKNLNIQRNWIAVLENSSRIRLPPFVKNSILIERFALFFQKISHTIHGKFAQGVSIILVNILVYLCSHCSQSTSVLLSDEKAWKTFGDIWDMFVEMEDSQDNMFKLSQVIEKATCDFSTKLDKRTY